MLLLPMSRKWKKKGLNGMKINFEDEEIGRVFGVA